MATKNINIADASEPKIGTPYDDVFRTLLVDCPELVIPLINEAFGEHYSRYEKVTVHQNEIFIAGDNKRVTDSHIGIRQKKNHAE